MCVCVCKWEEIGSIMVRQWYLSVQQIKVNAEVGTKPGLLHCLF